MKTDFGIGKFFSIVLPYRSFPCQIFIVLGIIFVIAGLLKTLSNFLIIGFFFITISLCFYYSSKQEPGVSSSHEKNIYWGNIFAFVFWFIISMILGFYIYITNSAISSFIHLS